MSFSSLSSARVVSSAYLRLFLPPITIPAQHFSWCAQHIDWINRVTDSPVTLLSQSWTNQLFHAGFYLLLLDQHTGFSRDRQDGLVFPSFKELSTAHYGPLSLRCLHSSPMLAVSCLKSGMLGFSILWISNFQMSKLDLEKEEEPNIKLPTFAGS